MLYTVESVTYGPIEPPGARLKVPTHVEADSVDDARTKVAATCGVEPGSVEIRPIRLGPNEYVVREDGPEVEFMRSLGRRPT